MKIPLYKQDGSKAEDITVSDKVFGVEVNEGLMHRILMLQLSNGRIAISHTKTKGEVRGGGKKPYKQKHTGRARQGSTRNPHFVGGGVAFGPRSTRNYTVSASKKERRLALFSALSAKAAQNRIAALESFDADEMKTKVFAEMLKKLPFERKVLFILPQKSEGIMRTSRNIPHVKTLLVNYLNLDDLLKYDDVVFLKEALPKLEEVFTSAN
ncbi:50S ribosomal protein L4 [Candidatus Peregrinibacteria bacterium CG_4_9_14_0_2_um_filter_53_11]|nr:MAG: 50S ribosomal protein L4 [Candidatus Peregrinibacteria bacterium CG_4_9_14_0_2_um_filter_53_11]